MLICAVRYRCFPPRRLELVPACYKCSILDSRCCLALSSTDMDPDAAWEGTSNNAGCRLQLLRQDRPTKKQDAAHKRLVSVRVVDFARHALPALPLPGQRSCTGRRSLDTLPMLLHTLLILRLFRVHSFHCASQSFTLSLFSTR